MEHNSIQQKIKMVLETPLGSVPHLPSFGSTIHEHLDEPENTAVPHITSAAYTALSNWIPELHITGISFSRDAHSANIFISARYNNENLEFYHALP